MTDRRPAPLIAVVGKLAPPVEGVRRGDDVVIGRAYLTSLMRAGGQGAVVLPAVDAIGDITGLVDRVDGAMVIGGGDVDPSFYGQEPAAGVELGGVEPIHDRYEIAFLKAVLAADKPLLAICRGAQILNVALGGSLVQHVEGHRRVEHRVVLDPGSLTAAAMGTTEPLGASSHHQVIDRLGQGLVVTGRSPGDDYVEAVELPGARWVVAVQWHPEKTAERDPAQQALFDAFVERAARPR
ncbi:MAG: gamma-glutamyl-gamma-aminobutyrate hydrolase family protein [Acidimicrobiia bacterium]